MKHCIVNFSDSKFSVGQERLVKSLKDNNYKGDILTFNSFSQVGSKSHSEVPYQFKVYAIMEAYKRGYDIVLYCDASLYAIKDVMSCIYYIQRNGWLLEYCGFNLAQFCTDEALNIFGINRDEAEKIQLHSAGFTGLDFRNKKALEFFNEWYRLAKEEKSFIGDWNNKNNQCSKDIRCLGHRHDQSVASFLSYKLGVGRIKPYFMQYYFENTPIKKETIFLAKGIC